MLRVMASEELAEEAVMPPKQGIYARYIKRVLDFVLALLALLLFWWVLAIVAILVRVKLGSPVIFKQPRPGKNEKIFMLYKFRSMTDDCDAEGNLLPDEVRLTKFGRKLRSTSLDELPELLNILKGDMAIVGPRPQLVRDMVFMTSEQRRRHKVRPGLTGLAQVNGRNLISWDKKLQFDLEYISRITVFGDASIVYQTVSKVMAGEGVSECGQSTSTDYGEWLLETGQISSSEFEGKNVRASKMVEAYLNGD